MQTLLKVILIMGLIVFTIVVCILNYYKNNKR